MTDTTPPPLSPIIPPDQCEEGKHPLQSKTLIFNALFGLLPFAAPKLYQFIMTLSPEQQLQVMSGFFAIVNIILRYVTKTKLVWGNMSKDRGQVK